MTSTSTSTSTVDKATGEIETAATATPAKITPKQALTSILDANRNAVGASLPSGFDQDRFVRLLLTAANTNPDLFTCDHRSFLAAGVAAAQLGLEPNDARGLAYLIPFKDKRRGKIVQLVIGYKGMLDLARRSGMVSSIYAFPVFDGDRFEYRLGLDPSIEHVPNPDGDEHPDRLTHVYAVAKINGDPQFVVLSRRQIDKVRDQSPGAKSSMSPWNSHYVEMAQKTALRRLCKTLPQTVEMAHAVAHDEGARDLALSIGDLTHIPDGGTGHDPAEAIEATATDNTPGE